MLYTSEMEIPRFSSSRNMALAAVVLVSLLAGCKSARQPATTRHIKIAAHKYAFEPSVIRLKQGEPVELEISTLDVQHGFEVKDLGVDESIQKGKPAIVAITPQRKGEYRMNCDIICGPGHDGMQGTIVVD